MGHDLPSGPIDLYIVPRPGIFDLYNVTLATARCFFSGHVSILLQSLSGFLTLKAASGEAARRFYLL